MLIKNRKFWGLPAMLLALTTWACTDAAPLGPSETANDLLFGPAPKYKIVTESTISSGVVTKVIGVDGGNLQFGNHMLQIPAGAVSAPTTFTLTKLSTNELRFGLTATRVLLNDVGSRGFAKPLTLKFNFQGANNVPSTDTSKLVGVWVKLDGSMEPQPTAVDIQGSNVFVTLTHFSDYALALP